MKIELLQPQPFADNEGNIIKNEIGDRSSEVDLSDTISTYEININKNK